MSIGYSGELMVIQLCFGSKCEIEIAVVLRSNKTVFCNSKTHSYAGFVGFDCNLAMYCSESLSRLSDREGSSASTYSNGTGKCGNHPEQV